MTIGAAEANLFARVLPGAEEPDMQYLFVNFTVTTYEDGPDPWPGFTFSACQCRAGQPRHHHPASPDPEAKPVIRANYLEAAHDQRLMVEGVKYARRLAAQAPLARLILEELTPGPTASSRMPDPGAYPPRRRHRLPSLRHRPDGPGRPRPGGQPVAAEGGDRAARRRCQRDAADPLLQHPAAALMIGEKAAALLRAR